MQRLEALGGIAHIFLTHRDDVADAERYAEHFDSRRIIHRDELSSQPGAEVVLDGEGPWELAPAFSPSRRRATPGGSLPSPAEDGPRDPGNRLTSRQEAMSASILGAAQMALHRCREVAGARLRRMSQECNECGPKIDGVVNHLVASTLGQAQTGEWGDLIRLVSGAAESFRQVLTASFDVDDAQARALAQMIEVYAARTLFDSDCPELPPGFVAQVEKAREVSNALVS